MLIDSVDITVKAGSGGDGIVAWRREKHVPKGGPDGGDGGQGGAVIIKSDNNTDTLADFRYRKVFQAEDGQRGMSKKKHGRAGKDLTLTVPVGTAVTDLESEEVLHDFTSVGDSYLLAKGGKGGLGNPHFATSTHQRPEEATPGQPGETKKVRLELKLIADVALVGQPNAGKSSLINCLTDAHSRIGAYAFSTREPVLGVMEANGHKITLVDLPGLLEGAHRGRGLGVEFLKHAERVRAIVHVVDVSQPDLKQNLSVIKDELRLFSDKLAKLPSAVVLTKSDLLNDSELTVIKESSPRAVIVSAQTKSGINNLREKIIELAT